MKRKIKCRKGEKRFTVLVVNHDPYDSHAGRSFEQAFDQANPDRGSHIEVYATCAMDGGAARMPGVYRQGQLLRQFRTKRGG